MLKRLQLKDLAPTPGDFRCEVLAGLSQKQKVLPPKFFYDAEGCRLFDAICEQPEYYLTRTEIGILCRHADEIAAAIGPDITLIELGSGSSRKIRLLLQAVRPRRYVPIDIARDHLFESAAAIADEYAWLEVEAICADYSKSFRFPEEGHARRKVAFFPGSSIGNFAPSEAVTLLRTIQRLVGEDGALLIGYDLQKDRSILYQAYNDNAGVTAAFNLNLLRRINRELGGSFDIERFTHLADFSETHGRMEMHLVSSSRQVIPIADQQFHFLAGETIHTENSYKYTRTGFAELVAEAGFALLREWTDPLDYFCVQLLGVRDLNDRHDGHAA